MSEEKSPDWSPSFHRLRTETIIFSLLFFAFTHGPVSLEHVPVLGIEIKGGAPKGALLFFLFLFCAYFWIAWIFRYNVDRQNEVLDEIGLERFKTLVEGVPGKFETWLEHDTENFVRPLNGTVDAMRSTLERLPDAKKIHGLWREISVETDPSDMPGAINKRREMLLGEIPLLLDKVAQYEKDLDLRIESLTGTINRYRDSVLAIKDAVPERIKIMEENTEKLRQDLRSMRSARVWDRYRFGFWIPFGFSTFLIGAPLIELAYASYIAPPSLVEIYNCMVDAKAGCLTR